MRSVNATEKEEVIGLIRKIQAKKIAVLLIEHDMKVVMPLSERVVVMDDGEKIAEGVSKVRSGDIVIEPGYDGVFGTVKIWQQDKEKSEPIDQQALF